MSKVKSSNKSFRYEELVNHFREQVASRVLKPGDQLPSFAQMQAEHGIGQSTLEKVYSILEEERLVVRQPKRGIFVAESRRREVLNVVGVILGISPWDNDYYSQLLQGIQQVGYKRGVEILLLHENSTVRWEKMDGVIIADKLLPFPSQMPAVTLIHSLADVPGVRIDEYTGMFSLTRHLIEQGHQKIAYLHSVTDGKASVFLPGIARARLKAYRDALRKSGIQAKRAWAIPERDPWEWIARIGLDYTDVGYYKMKQWLELGWGDLGCTAILGHNDEMALGIIRALHEAGYRVPQDVSVAGYDGTAASRSMTPALTTVAVPLREAGARGLEILLDRIHLSVDELAVAPSQPTIEVLPTQLVVRESTVPLRAGAN